MSTCTPSVCPPPSVWGLGMLRYGYHSCKKIIRVINMWDNFSSSTPFEAVTNFLLLDTEVMFDCDITRTTPVKFLLVVHSRANRMKNIGQLHPFWKGANCSQRHVSAYYTTSMISRLCICHPLQIPLTPKKCCCLGRKHPFWIA